MRRTKIICTIGPSSQDEDMLRKIILAGMNVARFNFSHGDYEEHGLKLERTRKISRELNLPVAVLLDTRGPEIRPARLCRRQSRIKGRPEVHSDHRRDHGYRRARNHYL